jgi:hypothetical protein
MSFRFYFDTVGSRLYNNRLFNAYEKILTDCVKFYVFYREKPKHKYMYISAVQIAPDRTIDPALLFLPSFVVSKLGSYPLKRF